MAAIQMNSLKQKSLEEICDCISAGMSTEQVAKIVQNINNVEIYTLVYEKFFFRNGSYASLTVVLTEYNEKQTACIVASGGGAGLINLSWGAEKDFSKSCEGILKKCGFTNADW